MHDDGEITTFYFIVPENTANGTVYKLTAEVNQWLDSDFNLYEIDTLSGSITVQ